MKKNLLFIGLAVLAMAGCQKVEGPDKPDTPDTPDVPVADVEKTIQVTGVEWTADDVVGVYTTSNQNLEFKN